MYLFFYSVDLLYYKLHKTILNRGGAYTDSPEWLKNKKATINPKNNGDKCFQYAVTVALNYQNIKNDLQRILNIQPFVGQYNWKEINFPSHKNDWNEFEKNNKAIALNILYVPHNTKRIRHAYKSKHNLSCEIQVILLMIADGKKSHYLAVKKLSTLLRGIKSKHDGDFYCLNCFHLYITNDRLKKHENVCKVHDYCYVEMLDKDNNILKHNHGEKSMQVPFIIYADVESLLEKSRTCHNNPKESSTTKINKHTPSRFSLFTHCSFDNTKCRLDYYSGQDCMKMFCKDLKEHATKIINYEVKNCSINL